MALLSVLLFFEKWIWCAWHVLFVRFASFHSFLFAAKEISYASKDRNNDTISIECCIPDDTGRFNDATYQTLVHLVAWLCGRYDLTMDDVIRHYDVTGKNCPKYYVENPDAWIQMKSDIAVQIDVDYGLQDVQ